jgi:hypothetical protein
VARPDDPELQALQRQFVCARVTRMNEVDIGLFEFDYDLTWMSFFLDAHGHIYSRYGGRDGDDPEGRLSSAGLKHTMRRVLAEHARRQAAAAEPAPPRPPVLPRDRFAVKGKGCLHCHHVWEGLRRQARREKRLDPDALFVYPPPENVGLTLDLTAAERVTAVKPGSPADRAGVRPGDRLDRVGGVPVLAQGDVMWALHSAPAEGPLRLTLARDGRPFDVLLTLDRGWKRTDLSWRRSVRKEGRKGD